jgi:SulP family sulfate permease
MPYAKLIPLTVLSAILIVVAYNMSEWRTFRYLLKSTRSDVIVMFLTFFLTVAVDLVVAIEIGMVMAMYLFIINVSEALKISNIQTVFNDNLEEMPEDADVIEANRYAKISENIMIYEVSGPLLFGASNKFMSVFEEIKHGKNTLVLRMANVPVMDATGLYAINNIEELCKKNKILLVLTELQKQPSVLLKNCGFRKKVGRHRIHRTFNGAIKYLKSIEQNT